MSLLLATLLQLIAIILFHRVGVNHIALGPMAVLFSVLYQYSRIVPPVYIYRIFGISLNNKSTNYILALQVCVFFLHFIHKVLKLFTARYQSTAELSGSCSDWYPHWQTVSLGPSRLQCIQITGVSHTAFKNSFPSAYRFPSPTAKNE